MSIHRVLILLTMSCGGCSWVSSEVPLGTQAGDDVMQKLEGVWANAEGEVLHVKHVKGNELRLAGVAWSKSTFKVEEFTAFVGVDEDRLYVNMLDEKAPKDKPQYSFVRLGFQGDDCIILVRPCADAFAKAVEAGHLAGDVKTGKANVKQVRLTASTEELAVFVEGAKSGEQFDVDSVVVINRVGKVDERKPPKVEVSEGAAR